MHLFMNNDGDLRRTNSVMRPPISYSHGEWAAWYDRVLIYPRTTPDITQKLRTQHKEYNRELISLAETELVKLDNDIIASEFLALFSAFPTEPTALIQIVHDMSRMAQELLQALVEAKSAGATQGPKAFDFHLDRREQ